MIDLVHYCGKKRVTLCMVRKQLPVITPLKLADFGNALFPERGGEFGAAVGEMVGARYSYPVSSGRAALCTALQALRRFSDRKDVIIPAYTCPTVPLSVARAGLRVKLCDVDLRTFNLDLDLLKELMDGDTLAVVVAHFYGFPCDMSRVIDIAGQAGAFVVEDVAQAAGARFNGKRLGAFGDMSCFSLNRGKCFTTYNGGIVVTDNEQYAAEIESMLEDVVEPGAFQQMWTFVKLLGMHLLSRPRLWWFISKIPLGFEPQYHSIDFRIEKLSDWQAAFGCSVLKRLDEINAVRVRNGEYLMRGLEGVHGIKVPQVVEGAEPIYLRFPVIVEDVERRERLYKKLHRRGIGASKMYLHALNGYEYLRDIVPRTECPRAEYMAERILMLPTHPLVTQRDLETIVDVFRSGRRVD